MSVIDRLLLVFPGFEQIVVEPVFNRDDIGILRQVERHEADDVAVDLLVAVQAMAEALKEILLQRRGA